MLTKKLPHLLITLLLGILVGCGASTNPLADEAKSNVESQNYQAALESAKKSIEQHPGDPLGYYYKAVALGEIAGEKEDVGSRADLYKQMNEAFQIAKNVADTSESKPSELSRISSVKTVLWQTEHNQGIEYIRSDSLANTVENPTHVAVQHLKNATIIQPDSSLSWNVLAQVAAMDKDYENAVDSKKKYISMVNDTTLKAQDYLQLAGYYYQLDKQQEVLETFQEAQKRFPNNEDIVSNLADAYNRVGKSEQAISTIEKLLEQNPENPQYHLVLGTQIYKKALKLGDTLETNSEKILQLRQELKNASGSEADQKEEQIAQLNKENTQLQSEIDDLTARAEDELKTVLKYRPDDADAYNTLGIIYQNKAKALFDLRNRTSDNAQAAKYDNQGKEALRQAMTYYEKATEIDPDNKDYWRSLFQIYTALGMDKKAQQAMDKAGIN